MTPRPPAPPSPSGFTLTGLVQHVAEVERNWFQRVVAGRDAPPIYDPEADTGRFVGNEVSLRWIYVHFDRGVRPAQRPRRPAPRAHRRVTGA